MPFKSKAQQRFMFAKHPRIARRWANEMEDKGKSLKKLPEKVKEATMTPGELFMAFYEDNMEKVAKVTEKDVSKANLGLAATGTAAVPLIVGGLAAKPLYHGARMGISTLGEIGAIKQLKTIDPNLAENDELIKKLRGRIQKSKDVFKAHEGKLGETLERLWARKGKIGVGLLAGVGGSIAAKHYGVHKARDLARKEHGADWYKKMRKERGGFTMRHPYVPAGPGPNFVGLTGARRYFKEKARENAKNKKYDRGIGA